MERIIFFFENIILIEKVPIGSLASWFSGIITAIGIIIALNRSKPRIRIKRRINNDNFQLTIINQSEFGIDLELLYVKIYNSIFLKKENRIIELNEFFDKDENFNQIPSSYYLGPKRAITHTIDINHLKQELEKSEADDELEILNNETIYADYMIFYSGRRKKKTRIRILK